MCWCAAITTPLEGVVIHTEPGLREWDDLRTFLEGRRVQFELVDSTSEERQSRFGTADRPVIVIGRHTVIGCDTGALVPLLP